MEPPVEYPSRESKHNIKESEINMSNPIFKANVHEQNHPGTCVVAVPELASHWKSNRGVQSEWNDHQNRNNDRTHHDEIALY